MIGEKPSDTLVEDALLSSTERWGSAPSTTGPALNWTSTATTREAMELQLYLMSLRSLVEQTIEEIPEIFELRPVHSRRTTAKVRRQAVGTFYLVTEETDLD